MNGLGAPAAALAILDGQLPPHRAVSEVKYARAEAVWQEAVKRVAALTALDGEHRGRLVDRFKTLETDRRKLAAQEVLARHQSWKPTGFGDEMAVVRGEIGKKARHKPIRKLLKEAKSAIPRIKPVMLMSPISVAQFIEPGAMTFDLLVIDEASQVRPEDAIGAIARARQVVVVGDNKQLPPTNFFARLMGDVDEDDDEDSDVQNLVSAVKGKESILDLCDQSGMCRAMLLWHYRSRHPSLIEVSNAEFYGDRLFLPPAPSFGREKAGFIVRRVPGVYDRGGKRTNEIEARALVDAAIEHANTSPHLSLGIVTFSITQRDLIDALIEHARRENPTFDTFMVAAGSIEPPFVKNLENVQGDERDVIFVSIGYGPRIAGAMLDSMAFGPVSTDGGERRLNVLFTRARTRCEVFTSFDSGMINLDRTTKDGPRVLKRFLRFGETGVSDLATRTNRGHDSPFEQAVADCLSAMGYEWDAQVGSAGFVIDLAVKDPNAPGRYLLAIECDGAAYHSARWARDRDRLRQDVLENLGWQFHRIWSTDWFKMPEKEKLRLKARIEGLVSQVA